MPITKVVTNIILANETSKLQESSTHAEHIECFVKPYLRALFGVLELDDVESFRLGEPSLIVIVLGNVELVLALWWGYKGAQKVDLVLTDKASRFHLM